MSEASTPMAPLSWFAQAIGARALGGDGEVRRVVTDSRLIRPGDLFVALRGERFDGHDFVAGAARDGAIGVLCERALPDVPVTQLVVSDALLGLQAAAQAWRGRFASPVVAVTGSNGKTTTKQLLAAVFAARGPVLATRGNLNNHIGLPLTLLELREAHRTAVIEMGANHLGEIARLTGLAQPQVGVITQAGDAHLEGFGSREGVARGKGELFAGMNSDGIAVINVDDAYADLWRGLARGQRLTFGIELPADVSARRIRARADGSAFELVVPGGESQVDLPLPGRHNVMNALAAAACGVALGLAADVIAQGLAQVESAQGRVVWKTTRQGARLIDDSYNANPTSMRAGLELLAQQGGARWAVLGGMAELGQSSAALHEACGAHARKLGIERLFTLGPSGDAYARGYGAATERYDDADALNRVLANDLGAGVTLLVKGSRSARMERIVAAQCGETNRQEGSH
ncbi:MAG: UDP-N-acetylmuramoyl-tripeptide--D-alanyl-D-alanine ligase [Panacagrimonas sp.]|nr:UDP-N-acetylmuramoyl-tripeptide--D-alanyl-D-alanine ligase [Panacagrimonas sp.]MCC2655632.1 UDP-N-acetylmuramoyl-tripeptide--D-alanyl-D-alanine ligase [Panacagrimonas sp.]